IALDEFGSVVDERTAMVCAAAISDAVRKTSKRLVTIGCRYEYLPYLQPDWVLDTASMTLARGSLRRPDFQIEIFRCDRSAWRLFAPHHYLDGNLHQSATC